MDGRSQASERTRRAILAAARRCLGAAPEALSLEAVAREADVSRVTVYNRFGSRGALLQALAFELAPLPGRLESEGDADGDPVRDVEVLLQSRSRGWARDPEAWRRLQQLGVQPPDHEAHQGEIAGLVRRLAESDRLRPGCSTREAAEVLELLSSFAAYDQLCRGGHRSTEQVASTLTRLAGAVLPETGRDR